MPERRKDLRHEKVMGQEDEGGIVADGPGIPAVGEVDARPPAIDDQARGKSDQPREAKAAQRE